MDKCAVVGVYNVADAAEITRVARGELTHRGQDATGIAAPGENGRLDRFGGEGLVKDAYDVAVVARHTGRLAVGQNLYSTFGNGWSQPTNENDNTLAMAHNGHLTYVQGLRAELQEQGIDTAEVDNDSKLVSMLLGRQVAQGATLEEAATRVYPLIAYAGSFCIVAMTQDGQGIAMRDPHGFRPLSIGQKGKGFVVTSETNALDEVGAQYLRDVNPGELLSFDGSGMRSEQLAPANPQICWTEYVYVANPDSHLNGRRVRDVRQDLGRMLGKEHPAEADIVIGVPNTSLPAAQGYAEITGIPYVKAIEINPKSTGVRSFMGRTQQARETACTDKLIVVPHAVEDKDVVVVDDSIFRGNVTTQTVRMLRAAGARKVHVRIASPPIRHRNNLGVATPTTEELIAHGRTLEEIRRKLGADSLGYLSLQGMVEAIGLPAGRLSLSDITGENEVENINRARLASV